MSDVAAFVTSPGIERANPPASRGWSKSSRPLKFGVALALLAVGAYALLAGHGFVASDNAVVSAYTVSLRSPISGTVSDLRAKVGESVTAGTVLAHLTEPRVDDQRLVDLENLLTRLRSDRTAYEAEHTQLAALRAGLVERADARNKAEADYLSLQAVEADRQARSREVARLYAQRDLDRKTSLGHSGFAPAADVDRAYATNDQAAQEAGAGQARLAYMHVQADSARRGILLESGSNDVPYSQQRADEIAIRLAEIEREIGYIAANDSETTARIEAERQRVSLLRGADLVAPADGMVWKLGASEGERLAIGDTAVQLVDCGATFILAAIPQDRYSDVAVGGTARVRLSGETADRIGRVVAVTGEATLANDRNLAAAPLTQRSAAATARIEFAGYRAADCPVGRTARVLLPTAPGSGIIADFARRLF